MEDDKDYLLKKEEFDLREEYSIYQAKKRIYESMVDMMINYTHTVQERFLLSDLHKLINVFDQKSEVVLIKLQKFLD